jgi:hypothetical protein
VNAAKPILLVSLFLSAGNVFAQSCEKELPQLLSLGELPFVVSREGASFGPTVALEVTPIENRLELEAGVTCLFRRHSTEWSADLLPSRLDRGRDQHVTLRCAAGRAKQIAGSGHVMASGKAMQFLSAICSL